MYDLFHNKNNIKDFLSKFCIIELVEKGTTANHKLLIKVIAIHSQREGKMSKLNLTHRKLD